MVNEAGPAGQGPAAAQALPPDGTRIRVHGGTPEMARVDLTGTLRGYDFRRGMIDVTDDRGLLHSYHLGLVTVTRCPAEGDPCPAGCMLEWPDHNQPERLRANEDRELSCPRCWDV